MKLNNDNYYSIDANKEYWSVSQYKAYDKCEACGLAESRGLYERPESDALLIGSYVDAYFSDELQEFEEQRGSQIFKKNGGILAKFEHANDMINRIEADPIMLEYLTGEKQTIMSAELFNGIKFKIKPRTAIRNNSRCKQIFTGRYCFTFIIIKKHTGRTMHL